MRIPHTTSFYSALNLLGKQLRVRALDGDLAYRDLKFFSAADGGLDGYTYVRLTDPKTKQRHEIRLHRSGRNKTVFFSRWRCMFTDRDGYRYVISNPARILDGIVGSN